MEDLLDDFVAETRETLEAIAGEIVAWEAVPADRTRLDSIFRFVHTVKGSCGFLDLPRIEKLSHAAEDALAAVRAGLRVPDERLVSAVLAAIDRIAELVDAVEAGEEIAAENDADLILALSEPAAPAAKEEGPAAVAEARPAARASARSIRLPVELLDRMMSGVSDMVLARNELFRRLQEVAPGDGVEAAFERLSACVVEMREAITRTRMQRIDHLFTALPRLVRDVSAELGKTVTLEIEGGDVELDREMIEMIRDPLTHIVRNAIDHGIEAAAERIAAGKPAKGLLRVSARQSGNQILIEVIDDGRGIDGERLVEKALRLGVLTPDAAIGLTPAARAALIFKPGLSTADTVSAISGRGVGMDVVRANVERIGGVVDLDNRPGLGLRITLRVPLTLTIIPALTVDAGGHRFAIPRSAIEEIVRARSSTIRIEEVGGSVVARSRGRRLPVADLATIMGEAAPALIGQTLVVLKPAGSGIFALAVDSVHDHEELVVKPAAPAVMATGLYAGTTLPDNGRPMLLLDPAGLARAGGLSDGGEIVAEEPAAPAEAEATTPTFLFRDVDGALRGLRLSLVQRIEEVQATALTMAAGRLRLVKDGGSVPVVVCGTLPQASAFQVLRIGDGTSEVAYVIQSVVDIVPVGNAVAPAAHPGLIAGVVMVGDEPVELIDPFWLFAEAGEAFGRAAESPLCLLRGGDEDWMREILQPLLLQSGYRVAFASEAGAEEADLVIEGEGSTGAPPVARTPVVKLRNRPEGDRGSIYRYDRASLLSALNARPGR
jgi:two-component system chemotaxis sensor kinase CheA